MDKQKYQKELEVIDKAIDVFLNNGVSRSSASIECPKGRDFTNIQDRLREEGVVISQYTLQNLRDMFVERKAEGLRNGSIIELPTNDTWIDITILSLGKIGFLMHTPKGEKIREIYEEHYRYIKEVKTEWEHEEDKSYSYKVNVYGKKNVGEVDLPIDEFLSYYEECKDFLEYSEKWETCVEQLKEYANREQGKIDEEFCKFVVETSNNKGNLAKEIKELSEDVFKEIVRNKVDFSSIAKINLKANEINIFEEEWGEGYANLLDVLPPEQKENFKKYLINDTFKTFKNDLDEYVEEMFVEVCREEGYDTTDYKDWSFALIQTERGFTLPIENELAIECTLENFKKIAKIYNLNSTVEEIIELAWDGAKKELNEAECTPETFYHLLAVKEKLSKGVNFRCDSFFNLDEVEKVKEALTEDFLDKMRGSAQVVYREFIQVNGLYEEDSELLNTLTTEETVVFVDKKKEVYQAIIDKREVLKDLRNQYLAILEDNGSMIKKDEVRKVRSDLFFVDGMHHATLDAIRSLENIKKYGKLNVYNLALITENELLLQEGYQRWQERIENHKVFVKGLLSSDEAETDGGLRESINSEVKKMETCLEEIKALINKSIALTNEVIK